jgi:hypothetical protein
MTSCSIFKDRNPTHTVFRWSWEPMMPMMPSFPHPLTGISAIADIATGLSHTCAIAAGGGVKCWGYNEQGQLGIGSYESQSRPADVTGATRIRRACEWASKEGAWLGGKIKSLKSEWEWVQSDESTLPHSKRTTNLRQVPHVLPHMICSYMSYISSRARWQHAVTPRAPHQRTGEYTPLHCTALLIHFLFGVSTDYYYHPVPWVKLHGNRHLFTEQKPEHRVMGKQTRFNNSPSLPFCYAEYAKVHIERAVQSAPALGGRWHSNNSHPLSNGCSGWAGLGHARPGQDDHTVCTGLHTVLQIWRDLCAFNWMWERLCALFWSKPWSAHLILWWHVFESQCVLPLIEFQCALVVHFSMHLRAQSKDANVHVHFWSQPDSIAVIYYW